MQVLEVALPADTQAWLRQKVAEGRHTSLAAAIATIVAEHRLAELAVDRDDHLWAKPAIDAALGSLSRGEGSPLDDVAARLKQRLQARDRP